MSLKRSEVEKYAKEHWFTPCHDGKLYSRVKGTVMVEEERRRLQRHGKLPGDGWKAVLLPELDASNHVVEGKERGCFIRSNPNGTVIVAAARPPELRGKFDIVPFYQQPGEHDGLVDCAHYVSCCLTAGGVKIDHSGVPGLVSALRARQDTRTLGLEVTREGGERVMSTGVMQVGDVIAYFHADARTHERGYAHSALYMGFDPGESVHRLTCHTTARFKEFFDDTPWNITEDPDWRFTLIHFTNEVFLPLPRPLRFAVIQGAKRTIYEFRPEGHVVRSHGNAAAHQALGALPVDRGYWFIRDFSVIVFWPRSGQVARIRMSSFDKLEDFPMTLDGVPAVMRPL
jgi:hypothetical protein